MHPNEKITYNEYRETDFPSLLAMGLQLWTDMDKGKLETLLWQSTQSKKNHTLMAKNLEKMNVSFAIFSLRTDYVEGADQSPTGYLEGIFVQPDYRKMGIAKQFILLGEAWCKAQGCTQLGSDTWLTDTASRAFHKKVGFWEEEEVVHFLKNIK